jgi:RHH-type proline utilization regulon transcriptional repressor/proline dehydrogenase/delta 1-pyrroline-5-carboxylate dehydrogenase
MLFCEKPPPRDALRSRVDAWYRADEGEVVARLLEVARIPADAKARIEAHAGALVAEVRRQRMGKGGLDAFVHEYSLSNQEGVMLLCLAEALLRIPDEETAERLIREKLGSGDWEHHLGHSGSLLVNASTWALMLTGRMVSFADLRGESFPALLKRLTARLGAPGGDTRRCASSLSRS